MSKSLYICYFGLREPLVQTQVLPYLREIQKSGVKISLLTFEANPEKNWTVEQIESVRQSLADENIEWDFLKYHKSPSVPATGYDVLCGAWFIWKKMRREKINILHARAHVAALMGLLAGKFSSKNNNPKLLFDIRGFIPEEYTDAGIWKKNGLLYKTVKRIESWIFRKSDAFVLLNEKARDIVFPESAETGFDKFGRPVEVIPCCVDLERFKNIDTEAGKEILSKYDLANRRVVTYIGSLGGWYMTNETADFFSEAKNQDNSTFALVLTQSDPEMISALLKERGFSEKDHLIKKVLPSEIPNYLSVADIAVSFVKKCYSKKASSPTKIAEYLASGLPIVSGAGVGNLDDLIENNKVGVIVRKFNRQSYRSALNQIGELSAEKDFGQRSYKIAEKFFDLQNVGGRKYRRLYETILSNQMSKTLYLCYFGLREPLVQTQVLPYLREIVKSGIEMNLLTFEANFKENWTDEQIEAEKEKFAREGIIWHCLPYHKTPSVPATLYDIMSGVRFIIKLSRREKIEVLHARAHVPMLMALLASKITKSRTLFDIRGLMAEEYADAGVWRENSKIFRFVKYVERKGIEKASQVVVLTNRMHDHLIEKDLKKSEQIEVIPCCVDFARVEKSVNGSGKNDHFELIYAGSATGLYLLKEMGEFFLEIKKHKPEAFFRVLTASPPEFVRETFLKLGMREEDFDVLKVSPGDVPEYLKKAHLGISFRSPTFSQIGASPTKIPEYLACGLPIVSNYGIGDTDSLLESERVGVSLKSFDKEEMRKRAREIFSILDEKNIEEKCVEVAQRYFDLDSIGGKKYQNVYRRIIGNHKLNVN